MISLHTRGDQSQTISLSRAFSSRRKQSVEPSAPVPVGRTASQRAGERIGRPNISAPVALLSATNVLSFQAAAISASPPRPLRKASNSSSSASSSGSSMDDGDRSVLTVNTSGTMTDASSVENSPTSAEPEPNHLSCYFKPAVDTSRSSSSPPGSTRVSLDSPTIPQRVPSHSKRAHERLHRQRSMQRMMSPSGSLRSAGDLFSPAASDSPRDNPFGRELAQLAEVAEDVTHAVQDAEAQADAEHMASLGLASFSRNDYVAEIQHLLHHTFYAEAPAWSWI